MCEICNVGRGNAEFLVSDDIDIKIGRTVIADTDMAMFIVEDEDGYTSLQVEYKIGDELVSMLNLGLDFCPFCGRELKHRIKIDIRKGR